MTENRDPIGDATNAICDALRYLGDASYAILPTNVAHDLAALKKNFLTNVRSCLSIRTSSGLTHAWPAAIDCVRSGNGPARATHRVLPLNGKWKFIPTEFRGEIMEVLLADEYGFCFGVERAVEMVEDAVGLGGGPIQSLGPLIHNAQEMDRLGEKGVSTINSPEEADSNTIAVIRAHGVTPQVQQDLEHRAAKVIDATCPFVTRVQHLAERAAKQGRDVVVAGNPDHPEMIGVVGYAPDNTYVVRDAGEISLLPTLRSPLVVSQTTIKLKTFLEVAEAVRQKADAEPQVVNTICSATRVVRMLRERSRERLMPSM